MRVIVPYSTPCTDRLSLHLAQAANKLALVQDGVGADYIHMPGDGSYFDLLERCWRAGEGFILVEHDIVPWPGAIQQLANCHYGWCTLPYYCSVGWIRDGLGCTKFSAGLLAAYPEFLHEPFPACCSHTRYYCGLDRLVAHRMAEHGIHPHVHQPGVVNLNDKWTT